MTASAGRGAPRILIVTTAPQTIKGFLLPYVRHLRDQGWYVEAATCDGPSRAGLDPEFERVTTMSWSREVPRMGNVRALREMRRVLKRGRFEIVHVHTPIAATLTRAAAASLGTERPWMVYTAHGFHFYRGGDRLRNAVYGTVERVSGLVTDREIVINEDDAEGAVERGIVPRERLRLFPGIGIDLDHYAPSEALLAAADSYRQELGIPQTSRVYAMIAEFQPGKNHRTAIDALARLNDPDAHLVLAGDGPTRPVVEQQVADLGLERQVHFVGVLADVRPLMLTSDATLLPSRREGLSRSVLESLAIGVPVIGGRTRGIRDVVDPDLGILVDPDDVAGFSRAYRDVLAFPSHGGLRQRSMPRMETYSIDHLIALHQELYDELIAQGPRAQASGRI